MKSAIIASFLSLSVGIGSEPRITAIAPESPVVSARAQVVTVHGEDFRAGLTLLATTPGGAVRNLSGNDIQSRRDVAFQVWFAFDAVGTYSFVVINEDGAKSEPFAVQARQAAQQPLIDRVTPEELSRSQEPQVVTLTGRNFAPGLRLSLTDPTGKVTVTEEFDRLDAHTAVVRLLFDQGGPYSLMVTNRSGESSNTVAIVVR